MGTSNVENRGEGREVARQLGLEPREAVSRLATTAAAAVQDPETKAKLVTVGFYPAAICEAQFAAYLARQYEEYGRIIGTATITAQ